MKLVVNIARIIVGVLFIFSGLIKANDPLGLSYKMQEFFDVWGTSFLNDYSLLLSIVMIVFEIIAGVAVLLGWSMRLFSWLLLLLIIFFTFLTGYALFSGKIRECGCFGDCIPLQAGQSFVKDLILLVLIVFLFFSRKYIRPVLGQMASVAILFFTAVLSFAIQWYVLQHLPLVDCLAYREGGHILQKMKIPPGAIPDSTVIHFVYRKDGAEVEFSADAFPDDFNDSAYAFVRRYDKLVRKGNAEPAIKDFSLTDSTGQDITQSLLQQPGAKLFLFFHNDVPGGHWPQELQALLRNIPSSTVEKYIVTNMTLDAIRRQPVPELNAFQVLRCDATAVKTAARANPTLYYVEGDEIIRKWGLADFGEAAGYLRNRIGNK